MKGKHFISLVRDRWENTDFKFFSLIRDKREKPFAGFSLSVRDIKRNETKNLLQFLHILNYFSVSPDALQIIKTVCHRGRKCVRSDRRNPSGSIRQSDSLDLTALMTGFAEFFLYIICHCLYLAGVASVCDDKVISQYRYSMNINDANIFAFFYLPAPLRQVWSALLLPRGLSSSLFYLNPVNVSIDEHDVHDSIPRSVRLYHPLPCPFPLNNCGCCPESDTALRPDLQMQDGGVSADLAPYHARFDVIGYVQDLV